MKEDCITKLIAIANCIIHISVETSELGHWMSMSDTDCNLFLSKCAVSSGLFCVNLATIQKIDTFCTWQANVIPYGMFYVCN